MSESNALSKGIPDGWYEDPANPAMQRWWSGKQWTEHVRYAPGGASAVRTPLAAVTPSASPSESSDGFYIPMKGFHFTGQYDARAGTRYRSARTTAAWVVGIVVVGAAVGVALWLLLPR